MTFSQLVLGIIYIYIEKTANVFICQDGFGNASTSNADFVVTVLDVQDTPPSFFNLPYSIAVQEDKAVVSLFSVFEVGTSI